MGTQRNDISGEVPPGSDEYHNRGQVMIDHVEEAKYWHAQALKCEGIPCEDYLNRAHTPQEAIQRRQWEVCMENMFIHLAIR